MYSHSQSATNWMPSEVRCSGGEAMTLRTARSSMVPVYVYDNTGISMTDQHDWQMEVDPPSQSTEEVFQKEELVL